MKAKQSKGSSNGESLAINIINKGTIIQGEIKSEGDIRIDGQLDGIINSEAKVVIGPSGNVNGDINCLSADIHGKVTGTLCVKDILYLKSTANTHGDIETDKLVIESGATFNGNCTMGIKKEPAILHPNQNKQENNNQNGNKNGQHHKGQQHQNAGMKQPEKVAAV